MSSNLGYKSDGSVDLDRCASCFRLFDEDPFVSDSHCFVSSYLCGHTACGYDSSGSYVGKCLFPKCIENGQETRDSIVTKYKENEKVEKENDTVSDVEKQQLIARLKVLTHDYQNVDDNNNLDYNVKKFQELLGNIILISINSQLTLN